MLDMEVTSLHWPSYSYTRDQAKSVKRKWEEEVRSECSSPDQAVPQININKRIKTDLPFSSLMRGMAAKYQSTPTIPIHSPLMSIFSPMTNPYSQLMASMAIISNTKPALPFNPSHLFNEEVDVVTLGESEEPLDLSPSERIS